MELQEYIHPKGNESIDHATKALFYLHHIAKQNRCLLVMRVSISVFEAPEKTAELVPRMFQLTLSVRARTWDKRSGMDEEMRE